MFSAYFHQALQCCHSTTLLFFFLSFLTTKTFHSNVRICSSSLYWRICFIFAPFVTQLFIMFVVLVISCQSVLIFVLTQTSKSSPLSSDTLPCCIQGFSYCPSHTLLSSLWSVIRVRNTLRLVSPFLFFLSLLLWLLWLTFTSSLVQIIVQIPDCFA